MDKRRTAQIVAIEGWPWVASLGALVLLMLLLGAFKLALFVLVLLMMAAFYFRNPERIVDEADQLCITAPIDGRVESVTLQENGVALALMNTPLDAHLLRAPCSGHFAALQQRSGLPGLRREALKALMHRDEIRLESDGPLGVLRLQVEPQMALGRYYATSGDRLFPGQRIGFVPAGRVTLLLPKSVELRVAIGDRLSGGESVIGFLRSDR
jgi:phosphatidylserine decarboxylase